MVYSPGSKSNLQGALTSWYTKANTPDGDGYIDNSAEANGVTEAEYNAGTYPYYGPPNTWDVRGIPDMSSLFSGIGSYTFHPEIGNWDTINVTSMLSMFSGSNFNQNINTNTVTAENSPTGSAYTAWDTQNVTNMEKMFYNANLFNQPIGNWNTSNVTTMAKMFDNSNTTLFNQDINTKEVTVNSVTYTAWDTSRVTSMNRMFYGCWMFNQDIGKWNTTNVTDFGSMFMFARRFNCGTGTPAPYNSTELAKNIDTKVVTVGNNTYLAWDTQNAQYMAKMFEDATYSSTTEGFNKPIGNWNTSKVVTIEDMFRQTERFNQDITTRKVTVGSTTYFAWDTLEMTNMKGVFFGATDFDGDVGNWNTSLVTTTKTMFRDATNFSTDVRAKRVRVGGTDAEGGKLYDAWSMSSIETMDGMFSRCARFNQNISFWKVDYRKMEDDTSKSPPYGVNGMFEGTGIQNGDHGFIFMDIPSPYNNNGIAPGTPYTPYAVVNGSVLRYPPDDPTDPYYDDPANPEYDPNAVNLGFNQFNRVAIQINGQNPFTIERGETFVDPGATSLLQGTLPITTGTPDGETPFNKDVAGTYNIEYEGRVPDPANPNDETGTIYTATRKVFVQDTVAPTLNAVSIGSNNNTTTLAKAGDIVTLQFTASEPIQTPIVTFSSGLNVLTNRTITYTNTNSPGNTWTATYTVNANDSDGSVSYSIAYKDLPYLESDGNEGTVLTSGNDGTPVTSGNGSVTIDTTAPTLNAVSIGSNNNTTTLAKVGDIVTLEFTASEPIEEPVVTFQSGGEAITDTSITYTNTNSPVNTWTATYTVNANDTNGSVSYSIAYTDLAGNAGNTGTVTGSVTVDTTVPVVEIVTSIPTVSNNKTPSLVFSSTEIGTITSTLPFSTTQSAIIGNNTIQFNELNYEPYSGYTITVTDSTGNPTTRTIPDFRVEQNDTYGNGVVVVNSISAVDLTDETIVGTTQTEQLAYTSNSVKNLLAISSNNGVVVLDTGAILPGINKNQPIDSAVYLYDSSTTAISENDISTKKKIYITTDVNVPVTVGTIQITKTGDTSFSVVQDGITTTKTTGDSIQSGNTTILLGSLFITESRWYTLAITKTDGSPIFNGYFSTADTTSQTEVTSVYETINGSTDFNTNIFQTKPDGYGTNTNTYQTGWESFHNLFINPMSFDVDNSPDLYALRGGAPDNTTSTAGVLNRYTSGVEVEAFDIIYDISAPISDPSCFNHGTKILCLNKDLQEEYIPVQDLRSGDFVKTYKHGYRKIDLIGKNPMVNNPNVFTSCMYKMEKTEKNGLTEDLIVTGGHCLLVDDLGEFKEKNDKIFGSTLMIDDKYMLLCGVSTDFVKLENTNLYTYYHFILENNGDNDERFGVWANGVLNETPSRNQFNDHKYTIM
jgi:surface protein